MNATKIMSVQQSRRFLHMTRTMLAEKSISPSFNIQSAAEKFNLSPNVFTQALTHKSYKHGKVPSNERLQYLGRRSLEFFAVEANKTKSVEELQKAVRNATADRKLVSTFDSLSLEGGVQCHLPSDTVTPTVKSQTVEALVGAIYHERGLNAAKEFAAKYVLN